jgi:hypothetical protein
MKNGVFAYEEAWILAARTARAHRIDSPLHFCIGTERAAGNTSASHTMSC